ncbi:MAG: HIT family protein [Anaerolineae bacterium]
MWAPWRMPYLRGECREVEGCIFCKKRDADDAEEHILFRGLHCFVMLNRYPYSNGHLMVVPYAHVSSLVALDDEVLLEMLQLVRVSQRILMETQGPTGFNVGVNEGSAAGAGIEEHIHMHVVPRWEGDANYMTVIGETRVIPQMLDDTYALLRPHFDRYRSEEQAESQPPT